MNIGCIGLGLMGASCAQNIMKHGHTLFIWGRRLESCTKLAGMGATVCQSPADVARQVDILITNVTDSPDVESLLFRTDGIVAGNKTGLIVIDMSTISALKTQEFAKKLSEKGMEFVDAPVSGGTVGATNGTLTFMVGASEKTFQAIRPLLETMGTTITRIGESGAGQVAKSCNQICITANTIGVAEAMRFAEANGVDFAPIREALLGGMAASHCLNFHGQKIMDNDYSAGFKSYLHLKDINIVQNIAKEQKITLPVTTLGTQLLEQAVAQGCQEEDSRCMVKFLPK